jgi:hypothetical protein
MRRLRMLVAAIVLGGTAGTAGAEDFWGRTIAGQPTSFIFGYGSLVDTASRDSTAKKPTVAVPARVSAGLGYVRCWCSRSRSGFTALGLRRPAPGESATTINGVLYPVEGEDMAAFDAREAGYARVEVPRDQIQAVSWQRLPERGEIWVYVPTTEGREPGVGLPAPSGAFPLLQSYIRRSHMSGKVAKQGAAEPAPKAVAIGKPEDREPEGQTSLRQVGGSKSRVFNKTALNAALSTL